MRYYNLSMSLNLLLLSVHRIGRTGRCGKTGIATTFINKMCGKCAIMSFHILYWVNIECFIYYSRGISTERSQSVIG